MNANAAFPKMHQTQNSLWRAVHLVVAPGAERHQVCHVANVIPDVGVLLRQQAPFSLCALKSN